MFNSRLTPVRLLILALLICYYGIYAFPLANNNEGLYAEIAREMLAQHQFLIPHLNGVPYLEKPPLLYWLISLCFQLFGVNATAARLVPASAALLTLISTYWLSGSMRLKPRAQAAIILGSSVGFLLLTRIVFFDMLLTAFISLSLAAFYHWYIAQSRSSLRLSYIALGLAVMTKGPIAIVLVPLIVALFLLITHSVKTSRRALWDPVGIGLFLIITIPWHILASLAHPGFAWAYFINEYVLRFVNKRIPHDYYHGPIYYYVIRVFGMLLPWSLLLPTVFMGKLNPEQKNAAKFLWLWFLVPFIFFSISSAKANYYMIIGLPPLALLLSLHWQALDPKTYRHYLAINFFIISLFTLGVCIYFDNLLPHLPYLPGLSLISYVVAGYCLFALIRLYFAKPTNIHLPLQGTAGLALISTVCVIFLVSLVPNFYSQQKMAEYIQQQKNHYPIYLYKDFEEMSSLVFYLGKPLPIVASESRDLYYAAHLDPHSKNSPQFVSTADFQYIARRKTLYVAIPNRTLAQSPELLDLAPFCPIFRDQTATLFINTPWVCMHKVPR